MKGEIFLYKYFNISAINLKYLFLEKVTLLARNRGDAQLTSAPFTLTVTVRRNQFTPVFQNEPYSFTLNVPVQDGQQIGLFSATDSDTVNIFFFGV